MKIAEPDGEGCVPWCTARTWPVKRYLPCDLSTASKRERADLLGEYYAPCSVLHSDSRPKIFRLDVFKNTDFWRSVHTSRPSLRQKHHHLDSGQ
jgi:hypothetical protein